MCFEDVPPYPWDFVDHWKLRQGKSIESTTVPKSHSSGRLALAARPVPPGPARSSKSSRERFRRAKQISKVVFQVQEGPEGSDRVERWPEKLRRMAKIFSRQTQ